MESNYQNTIDENATKLNQNTIVVIQKEKNVGLALLLTFLLGPLGMLYSTISGAIIMSIVSILVGIFTLGFGLLFIWPICMVWSAIAASSYNKSIIVEKRNL